MPELPKRDKAEKSLARLLLPEFERQTDLMLRAGLRPIDDLTWLDMSRSTAFVLEPQLRRTYALAAILMLTDQSVPLDLDDVGGYQGATRLDEAAQRYAQQRAQAMGRAITEATKRRYDRLVREAEASAEAAREAAERLRELLNRTRAEAIAATETTAAVSAGENGVADLSRELGGPVIRPTWNTERDKRTCPICWPLHRVPLIDVPVELQGGPPAHTLCRCWLTWERVDAMAGVMESRADNCGTGAGGFQPGNDCAKGGRRKQTETAAFKEWFGDSKVVDENGEPLVVYHGTGSDFTDFKPQHEGSWDAGFLGAGSYFTSKPDDANWYASARTPMSRYDVAWAEDGVNVNVVSRSTGQVVGTFDTFDKADKFAFDMASSKPQVMPVYLAIQNPLTVEQSPKTGLQGKRQDFADAVQAATGKSLVDIQAKMFSSEGTRLELADAKHNSEIVTRALQEAGYDGVVFRYRNGVAEYVVFDPTQIKSATGNRGTFRKDSAVITESKA